MADQGNTPADAGTAPSYADEASLLDSMSDADLGLDDADEERPSAERAPPAGDPEPEDVEPAENADDEPEIEAKDDDDDDAQAKPADDGVKVKLDDGQEVSLGDLKKGFLRQADYTRKTQEVARDRTEVASAADRLVALDRQTKDSLRLAAQIIQDYTPKAPDTSLLNTGRQEDVAAFLAQKEFHERGQARLREVMQAFQGQERGTTQMNEAERSALVNREMSQLIEKRPALRDAKKREATLNEITTMAQSEYGFSPQDLAGVTDHRAIDVLADAIAYRKLQSQKSAAIKKVEATAPMRPATRQAPGQRVQAGYAQAVSRARREGSEEAVSRILTDAELGL